MSERPDWLQPARLLPDLLLTGWLLYVAASYLGGQLLGALERWLGG